VEEVPLCLWNNIGQEIAEHFINSLPEQVCKWRDVERFYNMNEANAVMTSANLLACKCEFSEGCIYVHTVFSCGGRADLVRALTAKITHTSSNIALVGVYTCSPYIFTLGIYNNALFLVDTHPISEELGGNGNGLLIVSQDCSIQSCKLVVLNKTLWCEGN
jgi:hypothetical protein